jgi:hypothetical protein
MVPQHHRVKPKPSSTKIQFYLDYESSDACLAWTQCLHSLRSITVTLVLQSGGSNGGQSLKHAAFCKGQNFAAYYWLAENIVSQNQTSKHTW